MGAHVPTSTLFEWAKDGALEERIAKVAKYRDDMAFKERRAKRSRKPEYRAKKRDAVHELLRLEGERRKLPKPKPDPEADPSASSS